MYGPRPIITASDITSPLVMSMLARMRVASTSRPLRTNLVCLSAPDMRQKISGSETHSISQGPVERSWSATIASISAAACWRATEMLAWMYRQEIGLRFCGMVDDEPRPGA